VTRNDVTRTIPGSMEPSTRLAAPGRRWLVVCRMRPDNIAKMRARVRAASRGKEPLMLKVSCGRRRSSVDIQGRSGGESGHASQR